MSVGLDSEGLLAIYADWIAFLREKKGQFEGQLTKLQAKGGGKDKTPPTPPMAVSTEPASPSLPENAASLPPEENAAPDWLFQAPAPEAAAPALATPAPDDEGDAWM
ncbi:MAG TPA: hypothetical protein PK530_11820 [Anaerolineales bacterium]|nr:hypothetical protein [Anaerolineales bacterium]